MNCNCMCSGEPPIPVSGSCCYIKTYPPSSGFRHGAVSGWDCLNNVSETYCNSLYFGSFTPSGGFLVGQSTKESGVCDATYYYDPVLGSGGGCYDSCFIAGTKVSLAGDFVSIEELVSGDYVQGIGGETNQVIKLQKTQLGNRRLVKINNRDPFVTEDHPIFGHNGLKSFNIEKSRRNYPHLVFVGELKEGDEILTNTGYEKLETIEFVKEGKSLPLYNLSLDGDHTYFANGVAVHNKTCPVDANGDQDCTYGSGLNCPASGQYCGGFEIANPLGLDAIAFHYQYSWPNGTGQFDDVGSSLTLTGTIGGYSVTTASLTDTNPSYGITIDNSNGDSFLGSIANCFAKASGYCNELIISDGVASVTGDFCLNVSGIPYSGC